MKNKGFTLIELLAVIVILAIIALIATPIILGIINDARKSAKERSAELVYTGVEYAYTTVLYKNATDVVDDVTLAQIDENLSIENVKSHSVSGSALNIVTNDNVYCKVEKNTTTNQFDVTCNSKSDFTGDTIMATKSFYYTVTN